MNHYLVAVKDRAINAFLRPFTVPHVNAAIRGFTDEVNNSQGEMNKHPEDYELHCLAEWNDNTGEFNPEERPRLLARAQDLINKA